MAEYSSYWTRRRKVHLNVSRHVESLQENTLNFNEHYRQNSEILEQESDMDALTSDQNISNVNISHGEIRFEEDCESVSDENDSYFLFDASDTSESEGETTSLRDRLKEWAVLHSITIAALLDLLKILRVSHPDLPKDPRTLLRTETQYNIEHKCGGQYYYFGISKYVLGQFNTIIDGFRLHLQINIDGLPLFKSTQHQIWPILGRFVNIEYQKPFIIGIFSGTSKPNNLDEFLGEFLNEYRKLNSNGLNIDEKVVYVDIHSVICDAPARAFVKCVKSYSGYHGCDKCTQEGEWKGKITFPETSATRRTDASFGCMADECHHKAVSPLSCVNIGLVSQIPIDYMHLVCLGVMRRLLLLWVKGPLKCRLDAHSVQQISSNLLLLKNCVPSDFARRPRSLSEIDRWKATEFRQFLLYTGPLVILDVVHPNVYANFLLLFVGIHILLNNTLSRMYNQYAHDVLVGFVNHFSQIYGEENAVYNIHGLTHLSEDAANYGSLDNVSSFPFENFLCKLKRMVRKPCFPLSQVIPRLSEQNDTERVRPVYPILKKHYRCGLIPDSLLAGTQYQVVKTENFVLKLNKKDSCVRIGGAICLAKNIIQDEDEVYIVYKCFQNFGNFFTSPLQSSLLGIVLVGDLQNDVKTAKLSAIEAKCVLLPYRDKQVAIPFTDSVWSTTVYAVVEFLEDNAVEVVPSNWLIEEGKKCLWPSKFKGQKLILAVKNAVAPSNEFRALSIRVMYTGDYHQCRQKLSLAELTSDLQTEAEDEDVSRRKKRPNPRYETDSETDQDDEATKPRRSPRKTKKPSKSPPPAPIISPPVPLSSSTTLFEDDILPITYQRKSPKILTPRRLSTPLSPQTPSTSQNLQRSPAPAFQTLFDRN